MDLSKHPCFNDAVRHQFGRIHLPVAPLCNVQCNFCDRQYSCVNESRPGVTTAVLSPAQACQYLDQAMARDPRLAVVGIAGPGDPMANIDQTLDTLRLVRRSHPELLICLATNGLNLPPHIEELAELRVSHVTLTINAVDPSVGAKIYAWIRDGKRRFRGEEAARRLLERQLQSIRQLKEHEILVKVNSIIIPGINDNHLEAVASTVADLGADVLNAIPLYPVQETPFAELGSPDTATVQRIRNEAAAHLPLMHHCTRCRADASGLLGESLSDEQLSLLQTAGNTPLNPHEKRPYVAVATMEGVLVNLHLGEADELAIYGSSSEGFEFMETRKTPSSGGGQKRWEQLADLLPDCRAVLTASAGRAPTDQLARRGIRVVMMEGLLEEGLEATFANRTVRAPLRREHSCGAGAGCSGNGMGCG
jgi:nitrogen fixation protein NifB